MKNLLTLAALLLLAAAPARADFTLTLSTAGPLTDSAVITSTPGGIVCPGTCSFAFAEGSTVTLGAVWPSTMAFVGWGDDGGCKTNRRTCDVPLPSNMDVSATFVPMLTLGFSGTGIGSVRVSTAIASGGRVYFSTGSASLITLPIATGTTMYLTRSTGTQSSFTGWTDSASGCSTASTCTVVMDGYVAVVATFTASGTVGVSSYTIRVNVPTGGGIVRSTPSGITCGTSTTTACTAAFVSGGSISFSTEALAGYQFAGWANGGCSGKTPCVITSTSPLQGMGGIYSPSAYFYRTSP